MADSSDAFDTAPSSDALSHEAGDPASAAPVPRSPRAAQPSGVPTQDWLSRGLKHPAGRGWEGDGGPDAFYGSADYGAAPEPDPNSEDDWRDPELVFGTLASERPVPSDREVDAKLAQWGVALKPSARAPRDGKPSPHTGGWPGGWLPGDAPLDYALDDPDPYARTVLPGMDPWHAPFVPRPHQGGQAQDTEAGAPPEPSLWTTLCGHPAARFDAAARVRFLDRLATTGNVRASAARAGVSRETAYRARRRYPDFARLWDAAMVEARAHCAGELATHALDGVPVPVFVRGEHVATWRRIDARLLLAHMARLDRFAEANPGARACAGRFDELLAAHLGQATGPDFAEAAQGCRDRHEAQRLAHVPATREEAMRHAGSYALEDAPEVLDADEEEAIVAAVCAQAGEAWDAHVGEGHALVDAALGGAGEPDEREPPAMEFKSAGGGSAGGGSARGRNRVACVNTGLEWGWGSGWSGRAGGTASGSACHPSGFRPHAEPCPSSARTMAACAA